VPRPGRRDRGLEFGVDVEVNVTKATRLNLLICGAMRSGTTSLKAHMSEHPEIGFVDGEDIVVGDRYTGYYPFASPSLAQSLLGDDPKVYERISARLAGKKRYIADKRAYFMFFPHIPFNLREQLPDARLIFILRNPVEIAYSAFWYGERQPGSAQTFEAYLAESIARIDHVSSSFRRNEWLDHFRPGSELPVLVERGLYYPQIVRFYRLFRKEQILVLRFDRLKENPAAVMREVLRFLDLSDDFEFTDPGRIHNASPERPPLDPRIRTRLQEIYAESNRKLLSLLGWPPSLWD